MGDYGQPRGRFEEDESTVMMPTFSEGSFFADRYGIERLLGSGAMGRVYAATELHSQRRVALKVLHKERLGEEETVARFKREAEVLASIGHPCIVEIYTFHHTADGTPYLAMELLEGVTLKTRLQNAGRFEDPADFQPILDGLAGALDAAHQRGIIHRDMKPDNVFLPATGEPRSKLVDFGLSRMAKADKSLTHSGMILGTPRYMAPEQIRDASSAGPAGDIYSLGVIIHESLAGQSPYPAQDYGQLLGCVLEHRTTPLSEARPDLPRALTDVIHRAMAQDPAARFESCSAVAKAFGAAIGRPSQVDAIAKAVPARTPRKRAPSLSAMPMNNKGSTLAFDVAAFGVELPDPSLPLPEPPSASLSESAPTWSATAEPTAPDRKPDHGADPSGERGPSPSASGERAHAAPSVPEPPAGPPAQGGDTLFLGNVGSGFPPPMEPPPSGSGPRFASPSPASPSGPSHGSSAHGGYASTAGAGYASTAGASYAGASGPSYSAPYGAPSPGASSSSYAGAYTPAPVGPAAHAPPVAPAPKKSRLGLVMFFLAMIVVIVLSAAGGLALRAHMRGELDLPFTIPGVTPGT